MSPITTARHADVLVLTLDAPPVNALGAAMRTALLAAWREAEADPCRARW
jgi:3-hydroxyacyl-CoA dehydrogenase